MTTTTKAHYYEYYPHYMGTMSFSGHFNIEKMDELHAAYVEAEKVRKPWKYKKVVKQPPLVEQFDQACDAFEGALEETGDGTAYAWNEILQNWPKIRRNLERKGEWSDDWEEGSHAISMTSVRDARKLVARREAKHTEEEFDW